MLCIASSCSELAAFMVLHLIQWKVFIEGELALSVCGV